MSELPSSNSTQPSAAARWYPLKPVPSFQYRIWGQRDISSLYTSRPSEPEQVGEVWLTADDNRIANGNWAGRTIGELCRTHGAEMLGRDLPNGESPAAFPLLVKFLFTTDKLSVQVHPKDEYALRVEKSAGKTEMWHVLKAEPGARLAVGFRESIAYDALDRKTLRTAVESGDIEEMLNWMEVHPGDTFFVPAGTVHAIGANLVICEIQQNSDVTYRLFDYKRLDKDGRPRQLHLEKSLDVIEPRTSGGRTQPLESDSSHGSRICLAACPYFATEKITLESSASFPTQGRFELWIALQGESEFEAGGERVVCGPGEAVIMPAGSESFRVIPRTTGVWLRSYRPEMETDVLAPLRARGHSEQQLSAVCFPTSPALSKDTSGETK